jgi:type II secretory pathway component PulK
MALLMVVISLALISAVVTDLLVEEQSQYQVALRQRDALKAEALAEGGLHIGRLFLIIQSPIQAFFTQFASMGVPLPKTTVWEMLSIDSNLLSGLISGDLATTLGMDVSEAVKKRKEEEKKKLEEKAKEREAKTRTATGLFTPPEGGFGAFEGSFTVGMTDEESKISFRDWKDPKPETRIKTRKLLNALFVPTKYDPLFKKVSRADLIANIYDYLDVDEVRINPNAIGDNWGMAFGGSERDLYLGSKGVYPKNAYFDSLEELNLVHGFTDKHWEAFSDALTIYGQDQKINILSAKEPVIEPLIRYCAQNELDPNLQQQTWVDASVKKWMTYKTSGGGPVSADGFVKFLSTLPLSVNQKDCKDILGVESKNFTLKSQATINGVSRTLTLVTRVVKGQEERYYFRGQ